LGLPKSSASRMKGILARLRAAPSVGFAHGSPEPGVARSQARIGTVPETDARGGEEEPERVRFHLAVDDGGEFLVPGGRSLVLGHLRSPAASLPFLADVEASHVRFAYRESFHSGTHWTIEPLDAREVRIDGEPLAGGARVLHDGDDLELASNLALE